MLSRDPCFDRLLVLYAALLSQTTLDKGDANCLLVATCWESSEGPDCKLPQGSMQATFLKHSPVMLMNLDWAHERNLQKVLNIKLGYLQARML